MEKKEKLSSDRMYGFIYDLSLPPSGVTETHNHSFVFKVDKEAVTKLKKFLEN